MDFVNNMVTSLLAQTQPQQAPRTDAGAGDQSQFRSLLEQRRNDLTQKQEDAAQGDTTLKEQPAADSAATGTGTKDGSSGEEQLAMAAMAAAQLMIVVPQQEQAAPEGAAPVQAVQLLSPEGGQAETAQLAQGPAQQLEQAPEQSAPDSARTAVQPGNPQPVERGQADGAREDGAQDLSQGTQAKPADRQEKKQDIEVVGQPEERALFRDVQSAPVKVGNAAQTQQAEEAQPVDRQLFRPVEKAVAEQEPQVRVSLQPENLGSVTVELKRSEDGALHVLLHADNPRAQSILEKNAAGLQSLLMDSTQGAVQVQVERQQSSQGSQQQPYDQDGHNGQQGQHSQQEQQSRRQQQDTDFLQQLRLGLVPLDGEAS